MMELMKLLASGGTFFNILAVIIPASFLGWTWLRWQMCIVRGKNELAVSQEQTRQLAEQARIIRLSDKE